MSRTESKDTGDPNRKVGRGRESGTGPFAGTQHGGSNDGVTSAKPEVITGTEDATFETGRKARARGRQGAFLVETIAGSPADDAPSEKVDDDC